MMGFILLLKCGHIGPTLAVTTISFMLSLPQQSFITSLLISVTVFTGQLSIGWTNDFVDFEQDKAAGRINKPLVRGTVKMKTVSRAIFLASIATTLLSLLGPFGFRAGSVHLLGVGCGILYDLKLKRTFLSPLPYFVAFAALPSSIAMISLPWPPWWVALSGALLGTGAHFANTVKDRKSDRENKILGLPQLIGAKLSILVSAILFLVVALILYFFTGNWLALLVSAMVGVANLILPTRFVFPAVVGAAIVDVAVLVISL